MALGYSHLGQAGRYLRGLGYLLSVISQMMTTCDEKDRNLRE
jgi:hypothetical protein